MAKSSTSFKKGHLPLKGMLGKHHSNESKRKISKAHKNKKLSEEWKKKISESHKGKPSPMKGKKHSKETKKRIGLASMGHKDNLGRKHTEETKKKMRQSARRGILNNLWRGGISFEPYTINWTQTLKRSIRERDKYTCQICGNLQGDWVFDIHHIDYDKKNCNPENLIMLCRPCHAKTNHNRGYWIKYFQNKVIKTAI